MAFKDHPDPIQIRLPPPHFPRTFSAVFSYDWHFFIQSDFAKRQACVRSSASSNQKTSRRHTEPLVGHLGEELFYLLFSPSLICLCCMDLYTFNTARQYKDKMTATKQKQEVDSLNHGVFFSFTRRLVVHVCCDNNSKARHIKIWTPSYDWTIVIATTRHKWIHGHIISRTHFLFHKKIIRCLRFERYSCSVLGSASSRP